MVEIIKLNIATTLDIPADEMLRNIAEEKPKHAFVIVWPENGKHPTYHASTSDMPVILYQLQRFFHKCFDGSLGDDE